MSAPYIPMGGLVTLGAGPLYTFIAGRSKLMTFNHRLNNPTAEVMGTTYPIQIGSDGKYNVTDPRLSWEYSLHCDASHTVAQVEQDMNTLYGIFYSGLLETLIVAKINGGGNVSGPALLEEIERVNDHPTKMLLHLTFFIPNGLA